MSKRSPVRGVDHIGITVPDLDAASRFFEEAFDAKSLFDNIKRSDEPFAGAKAEAMVGLTPGTVLVTMRMMQLGNGPGLELFEVRGADQRPAVRFSDFGLQHFAVHVDDIELATERFVAAGGTMFSGPNEMDGLEKGEGNMWRYGRTPWGSVIELISSPGPQEYERETPLRRWKPPA
jgi:catechol 2,3-dioxygenase-like lactoylglutathione lyase family enzyme